VERDAPLERPASELVEHGHLVVGRDLEVAAGAGACRHPQLGTGGAVRQVETDGGLPDVGPPSERGGPIATIRPRAITAARSASSSASSR
jgi:hypothetical protein